MAQFFIIERHYKYASRLHLLQVCQPPPSITSMPAASIYYKDASRLHLLQGCQPPPSITRIPAASNIYLAGHVPITLVGIPYLASYTLGNWECIRAGGSLIVYHVTIIDMLRTIGLAKLWAKVARCIEPLTSLNRISSLLVRKKQETDGCRCTTACIDCMKGGCNHPNIIISICHYY